MEKQAKKEDRSFWKTAWTWVYRLRSVLLAVPVGAAAAVLAVHNYFKLPETVGINIQATGEYAQTITRSVAVFGPLAVTAVCLLMVFCSKRVMYPWLISLFSLVLPLLVYFTNIFPA